MAVTAYKAAGLCANNAGIGSSQWVADDIGTPLVGTETLLDDNVYAGNIGTTAAISNYLFCTTFGFTSADVPSGATIDGFEVQYKRFRGGIIVISSTLVKFIKAGSVVGNDIGSAGDWPTSEATVTYGSSTEKGGQSWTQSDVTATNFGVAMSITNGSTRSTDSVRSRLVDQVLMRIYYTASATNRKDDMMMMGC